MTKGSLLVVAACAFIFVVGFGSNCFARGAGFDQANLYAQQRSVKIYGAGGMRQLEAYQSGMLVSPQGHIATVSSVVLDRDEVAVILGDGRRYMASVVGTDPFTDIAVLKLNADDDDFPAVDLTEASDPFIGLQVLAFSNLYNVATGDEPVSVQHGVLSSIAPLEARRGAFATRFRDDVYILDAATNNPGAAGGLLTDGSGQPLGMLGKELRSELTGSWLNYALPLEVVASSVERVLTGDAAAMQTQATKLPDSPATFAALGFHLVPDVVPRTPPYVDHVVVNSPAAQAGIEPDDLVVGIDSVITGTAAEVQSTLSRLESDATVAVTLLRGSSLLEVELTPADRTAPQQADSTTSEETP